jgi:hypothetical protein
MNGMKVKRNGAAKSVISDNVIRDLTAVYKEIMWLYGRKGVSAADARAWYTHIKATKLRKSVRRFTGKVSKEAIISKDKLHLEHFRRIQTNLTKLIEKHQRNKIVDPDEFINFIIKYEEVHIVTADQNPLLMKHNGDYKKAGVILVNWNKIDPDTKTLIWKKYLKGKVSNAEDYAPHSE